MMRPFARDKSPASRKHQFKLTAVCREKKVSDIPDDFSVLEITFKKLGNQIAAPVCVAVKEEDCLTVCKILSVNPEFNGEIT